MRTVRHRWLDAIGLLFALGAAAGLMYLLLPEQTRPGQQVIPPLPASAFNPTQAFLTIFVVMTTIGAPVTLAIVLALVVRWVSKHLPASSAVAEAAAKATKPSAKPVVQPSGTTTLSATEERAWKIVTTVLSVCITGGIIAALWPDLVRLFSR